MFENYPDLLTINETIEILRFGRNKIYELVNTKQIKSFGNPHRILKSSIIDYINSQIK